jgi:hypothetical protein
MTNDELIKGLEAQSDLMIRVATGARIEDAQDEYKERRRDLLYALNERGIADPNPHSDLWHWYGYWKENLPTYQSRRQYVSRLYSSRIESLIGGTAQVGSGIFDADTGWERVDRCVNRIKIDLAKADNEEAFQGIGLLCREALISLAQQAFDPTVHIQSEGMNISATDAKRMLEAYLAHELSGGSNEAARKHAKASLDLANALQHKRTADFRDAAFCAEATIAVVNIVAILSGRRDRPSADS